MPYYGRHGYYGGRRYHDYHGRYYEGRRYYDRYFYRYPRYGRYYYDIDTIYS